MRIVENPKREDWDSLIIRPAINAKSLEETVSGILESVKQDGLEALIGFTKKFDGYNPEPLQIPEADLESAEQKISKELKNAIDRAARNIEIFHRNQQKELPVVYISKDIQCWQKDVPIERVGFYIPGGTAPLFSTVLMLGIPAMIAGCKEMSICTPANSQGQIHPAILYAASLCSIKNIYRVGGAQAIAGMAYGAGPISKCDKIFGPGNQYVTMAKQLVVDDGVAIDMPAGPSEVLVIADNQSDPAFIASDLLSQAEHGEDSQVILLCLSVEFANKVNQQLEIQLRDLPRSKTAQKALSNSLTMVCSSLDEMMDFSNLYAPEHLIICSDKARVLAEMVTNAGSVFIGSYTPESAGDYASGTNHTLPTNGYARSYSGLNLLSFMKTIQFQEIRQEGLFDLGPDIIAMAEAEGLQGHANAVKIRLQR